jgi:hypothetical protein
MTYPMTLFFEHVRIYNLRILRWNASVSEKRIPVDFSNSCVSSCRGDSEVKSIRTHLVPALDLNKI